MIVLNLRTWYEKDMSLDVMMGVSSSKESESVYSNDG